MDLSTFVITGPATDTTAAGVANALNGMILDTTTTGVDVSFVSQCLTDTFSVTNGGSAAPTICGTNSGEHSKYLTYHYELRILRYSPGVYAPAIYLKVLWPCLWALW